MRLAAYNSRAIFLLPIENVMALLITKKCINCDMCDQWFK